MSFERNWTAELLRQAPMIAPARTYIWPQRIEGEDDALARGAVNVLVRPRAGESFLVAAALGFKDPSMPTGVFGAPAADEICILAGGYAYIANVLKPQAVTLLEMKPVVQVLERLDEELLVLIGFTSVLAWGPHGRAWETRRLSWEGLRVTEVEAGVLRGFGWDLMKDAEVAFEVELATGQTLGGGYRPG